MLQELEELRMQVKEAQRIMMLHGPSKVRSDSSIMSQLALH